VSTPVARAHSTLGWVGLLLAAAALLVDRAGADIDRVRAQLRDERDRRIDAEDQAERLRGDLDGALEALHAQLPEEPAADEPPAP
jgi:hypothetical protein